MRYFLQSIRARTLLLSCSAVMAGAFLAQGDGFFSWYTFLLLIFTACLLQILSNLVNEIGDWRKGTDKEQQSRRPLSLQSNSLSEGKFINFIKIVALLSAISGLILIRVALGSYFRTDALFFLFWGMISMVAAVFYSAGKKPYGYYGMGDLAVFLFFGPVSVIGSYYLMSQLLDVKVLLISGVMGLLCTAVLNVNNIRDFENDKKYGKKTLAVVISQLGKKEGNTTPAKRYQYILIGVALLLSIIFIMKTDFCWYLFLPSLPFFVVHLIMVRLYHGRTLDKALLFLILGVGFYALSFVFDSLLF